MWHRPLIHVSYLPIQVLKTSLPLIGIRSEWNKFNVCAKSNWIQISTVPYYICSVGPVYYHFRPVILNPIASVHLIKKTYLNFRLSSCGWFLTYKQMRCWYELRYEEVMMRCPKFSRSLFPLASIANTKIFLNDLLMIGYWHTVNN